MTQTRQPRKWKHDAWDAAGEAGVWAAADARAAADADGEAAWADARAATEAENYVDGLARD